MYDGCRHRSLSGGLSGGLERQQQQPVLECWVPILSNSKNDVSFISGLIDTLNLPYQVDLKKVYATGVSMGMSLAYVLAEKLGNRLATVGGKAGAMYYHSFNQLSPTLPMPVMHMHGTNDPVVLYNGEHVLYGNVPIDTLANFWVLNAGCNSVPTIDTPAHQINTTNGTRVVRYIFGNSPTGASCRLYKILNGNHCEWSGVMNGSPNNMDFNASTALWNFFKQYSRPQTVEIKERLSGGNIHFFPNPGSGKVNVVVPGGPQLIPTWRYSLCMESVFLQKIIKRRSMQVNGL